MVAMSVLPSKRFIGILLLASLLISAGCATLTRGDSKQPVPVTSSPAGATIIVNGVRKGVTPMQIWLTRKTKDQVIRIEYPGYDPVEIRMIRTYSSFHALANGVLGLVVGSAVATAWYLASDETAPDWSICLGTAIGGFLLIDVATRAGYTLTPKDLTVTLTKAGGSPRVHTVLLDAEDFRNVKWIRVRRD
jgi:hypothetical protein